VPRVTNCQWAELGDALEQASSHEALERAVVDAFEAQHRWFRPNSPSATTVAFARSSFQ
jgi:hypothetical protein